MHVMSCDVLGTGRSKDSYFRAKWVGTPVGAAYTHAITQPPSEKHHPLWKAAVDMEKDEFGRKTKRPLYRRRTTSTALQLAVDHAFTDRKSVV